MPTSAEKKRLKRQYLGADKTRKQGLLGLSRSQLEDLLGFLDNRSQTTPCLHGFEGVEEWARGHRIDASQLLTSLGDLGAFCDCEVVFNLNPEDIFGR